MAADPQLEHRVTRLENDTISLYEIVTELRDVQDQHTGRFDRMDRRLDAIDHRLDGMDKRFDVVDKRFDGIEATLAEVLRRLPQPS